MSEQAKCDHGYEAGACPEDGCLYRREIKNALLGLAGTVTAAADQAQAMTDAELGQVLLSGKWTTIEVHEAGRRLSRCLTSRRHRPSPASKEPNERPGGSSRCGDDEVVLLLPSVASSLVRATGVRTPRPETARFPSKRAKPDFGWSHRTERMNMGKCKSAIREVRFLIEDEQTQCFVLVDAIGDCPLGVQGWHHKTFPARQSAIDILSGSDFRDYLLWGQEDP